MTKKRAAVYPLLLALIIIVAFGLFGAVSASASTKDGVVEFVVFTNPECPGCEYFNKILLPKIEKEYGRKIRVNNLDLKKFENVQKMINIEAAYGRTEQFLPQVYVGGISLIGPDEVRDRLEETINSFILKGGSDMPALPQGKNPAPPPASKPIYITYFYRAGCRECDPVSIQLDYLARYDSQIIVRKYDLMTNAGIRFNEAMCSFAGVPEKDRALAPSVFIGWDYYSKSKLTGKALQQAVDDARKNGTVYPWRDAQDMAKRSTAVVTTRFNTFAVFTVLGAGLVDGVNPCSFTVLIFLISYLAFVGRKGTDMLLIGGVYSFTVFITYFLIGIGVFSFVKYIGGAGKWVALGVGILTLLFGLVSLYDYIMSRRTGKSESTFGLPDSITRKVHQLIREKTKMRNIIIGAAVLGVMMSLLELGCTGQAYLPTIAFIARSGGPRLKAGMYLFAYNVMAILPLLVVFALVYTGVSSDKLVDFGKKHTSGFKLLTTILFFGLAALLFATL